MHEWTDKTRVRPYLDGRLRLLLAPVLDERVALHKARAPVQVHLDVLHVPKLRKAVHHLLLLGLLVHPRHHHHPPFNALGGLPSAAPAAAFVVDFLVVPAPVRAFLPSGAAAVAPALGLDGTAASCR